MSHEPIHEQEAPAKRTPKEIIDAFGGRGAVAEIVQASKNAVSNWYSTGIPSKYHYPLVEAAEKRDLKWITFKLLRATHNPAATRRKRAPSSTRASVKKSVARADSRGRHNAHPTQA